MTTMTRELTETLSLLSNMYVIEPTKEALENWRTLLAEDVPDYMSGLKEAINKINLNSEPELEALLWEYTRLFIGPYKLPCPPWESVYTSPKKLMMQAAYDEVQDSYKQAGLSLNNPQIMADHIGAELNFLTVVHEKINREPQKESYYKDLARKFLQEHLQKWVPPFTRDMEEAADSDFYKAVARVTREIISDIDS